MVQVPKSPIITPKAIEYLEKNGLLKPSKRTNNPPTPTKETQPTKEKKRETFKTTILRILKDLKKPIERPKLVEMAIGDNPPKSKRPEWVYNDIIRKLRKDQVFISNHRRLEKQMVSLRPILPEKPQQKK